MQTTKDFLKNEDCVEICMLLRLLPFILKKTFMRISELFGRSQILLLWTLLKPKVVDHGTVPMTASVETWYPGIDILLGIPFPMMAFK